MAMAIVPYGDPYGETGTGGTLHEKTVLERVPGPGVVLDPAARHGAGGGCCSE